VFADRHREERSDEAIQNEERSDEAIQNGAAPWIASRSLSSGRPLRAGPVGSQ